MPSTEPSARRVRLVTALLLVATFAAGTVTGAGLMRWAALDGPMAPPPPMAGPLPLRELDLSKEQREKVRAVYESHRSELDAVLKETFPKVREINVKIEQEIREVLTPAQAAKLDEIKARRQPPPPGWGHDQGGPPPGGPRPGEGPLPDGPPPGGG